LKNYFFRKAKSRITALPREIVNRTSSIVNIIVSLRPEFFL